MKQFLISIIVKYYVYPIICVRIAAVKKVFYDYAQI